MVKCYSSSLCTCTELLIIVYVKGDQVGRGGTVKSTMDGPPRTVYSAVDGPGGPPTVLCMVRGDQLSGGRVEA